MAQMDERQIKDLLTYLQRITLAVEALAERANPAFRVISSELRSETGPGARDRRKSEV